MKGHVGEARQVSSQESSRDRSKRRKKYRRRSDIAASETASSSRRNADLRRAAVARNVKPQEEESTDGANQMTMKNDNENAVEEAEDAKTKEKCSKKTE